MIEIPETVNGTVLLTNEDPDASMAEILLEYREKYPALRFSQSDIRFLYTSTSSNPRCKRKRMVIHISRFLRYCGTVYNIRRRMSIYPTIKSQLSVCGISKVYLSITPGRCPILCIYLTDRESLYSVETSNTDRLNKAIENLISDVECNRERWM